jgi:VIT1/CCC1 family predicted Fe2+/Mn2+ transporter
VIHRYLVPDESLGELLFGLIMALSVTTAARILTARSALNPADIVPALIGCNVAWGIIDGFLYVFGAVYARNRRVEFVRRLQRTATEAEAMAAVREEFGLEDEPQLPEEDRAAFHRVVLAIERHARIERARVRRFDVAGAVVIALLVALTALPGAVPFLLIDDAHSALRLANLLQLGLLFFVGFRWSQHVGSSPWRGGLIVLGLGLGMVVVAVLLGG